MNAADYISVAEKFHGKNKLTLEQLRVGVIGTYLQAGFMGTQIAEKFSVGRATVSDVKRLLKATGQLSLLLFCFNASAQISLQSIAPKFAALSAPVYKGNTLAFTWSRSPDDTNGVVAGYRFYYGTNYPPTANAATVGNVTNATLDQLTSGRTWYFNLVAYDKAGVESKPSNTVTNYIYPKVTIAPYVFAIRADAPNRTNQWQVSSNGTTWTTISTVVTNPGAALMLPRTNNGTMEFVRLK